MAVLPHDVGMLLTCILVAFFGGGIRAALAGPEQPFRAVAAYSLACGFTGLVVSLSLLYLGVAQPYLLLLLAALAGWVGPDIIERIAAIASVRVGAKLGLPILTPPVAPTPIPLQPPVEVHVHTGGSMQQPSAFIQATNAPALPIAPVKDALP